MWIHAELTIQGGFPNCAAAGERTTHQMGFLTVRVDSPLRVESLKEKIKSTSCIWTSSWTGFGSTEEVLGMMDYARRYYGFKLQ